MRASKILLAFGLLVFLFLGGALFYVMPVTTRTSVERVVQPAAQEVLPSAAETVVQPVMAWGPLAIAVAVILVLLVVVAMLVVQLQARDTYLKHKREEVLPSDALADLADEGLLELDDDGELPQWATSLTDDKPKRV